MHNVLSFKLHRLSPGQNCSLEREKQTFYCSFHRFNCVTFSSSQNFFSQWRAALIDLFYFILFYFGHLEYRKKTNNKLRLNQKRKVEGGITQNHELKDAQMFFTAEGNCKVGDNCLWVYHYEQQH